MGDVLVGGQRTAARAVLALVATAALVLPVGSPAGASPHQPTPTAQQVHAARVHAQRVAAAVVSARARVGAAQRRLDVLNADLEILVERWNAARVAVDEASTQLSAAQAAQADALAQAQFAQLNVDRLAVQTYQLGPDLAGGMGQWVAVIDSVVRSGGISSLTDRTADLGYISAAHRRTVLDAQLLHARAAAATNETAIALAELEAKQSSATMALKQMRSQQEGQKNEISSLSATLADAQRQLASAQKAATSLAHARSLGLAQARARAARERALARERARRAHSGGGGQSGANPGGNSGSGNSGSANSGSGNNGDRHDPSVGRYPQGVSHTTQAQRLGALAYARAHIGDPYVAGMDGPHAFDCSGLTSAAYRSVGWSMIHFSQSQFLAGEKVPLAELQPGDLVFYATDPTDWRTIHHVVFYAGNGMMIEAPHTGAFVREWPIYPDGLVPYGVRP
jgi:cell wall-associated NlpC family hydrolase